MTLPAASSSTSPPTTSPTKLRPNRSSFAPCSNCSFGPTTSPSQTTSGGEDRPDLLLYHDTEAKTRATSSETSPYLEALAVAELKPFRRQLDTRGTW